MKRLLSLLLLVGCLVLPLTVGCTRAPQKATEAQGMEGMDDMKGFDDVSEPKVDPNDPSSVPAT